MYLPQSRLYEKPVYIYSLDLTREGGSKEGREQTAGLGTDNISKMIITDIIDTIYTGEGIKLGLLHFT